MGNKPSSKSYEHYYQTLQQQRQNQQKKTFELDSFAYIQIDK